MHRRIVQPRAAAGLAAAAAVTLGLAARSPDLPLGTPPAVMGSPGHTALVPALASAGGRTASGAHAAEHTLAGPLGAGHAASSPSFSMQGGVVFTDGVLASSGPLLAAVEPRFVRAAGQTVTLHGAGFAGGATPAVTFAGVPAASVTVVDDTELQVATPVLVNQHQNPLGPVDVRVATAAGEAELDEGLIATPAYVQTSPARIGRSFTITHFGRPGSIAVPSWGSEVPGLVVPLDGIGGAIELPIIHITFAGEFLGATGVSSTTYPLPNKPNWVGLVLQFQSIEIESLSPLVAGFTNVVNAEVLP